jgi:hypothetical protein
MGGILNPGKADFGIEGVRFWIFSWNPGMMKIPAHPALLLSRAATAFETDFLGAVREPGNLGNQNSSRSSY